MTMNCPICRNKNIYLFHDKVWSFNKGKVYKCRNCDVMFINPMLGDKEEKELYKNYNKYVKSRGATIHESPAELNSRSVKAAKKRYTFIKKYFTSSKSILEIGSSTGAFLKLLKGRERYGVEPAYANREFSKANAKKVYSDMSQIAKYKKFDIICMFHLLEHIRKPFDLLKQCRNHLVKSGIILAEIPYAEEPMITMYNCKPFIENYFQPTHPFVYSKKALDYLFLMSGFQRKEIIFFQRYGLDNHLTWLSKEISGGDPYFKDLFGNNSKYKEKLQKIGKTDTIFYIAQAK